MIAALKRDEPQSERCAELLKKVPDQFLLTEPSIFYQEVCGTLARRVGLEVADEARRQLDRIISPERLADAISPSASPHIGSASNTISTP